MDSSGDDFEDDPFNYQPLKRRKLMQISTPTIQKAAKSKAKPRDTKKYKSHATQQVDRTRRSCTQIPEHDFDTRRGQSKNRYRTVPSQRRRTSQKSTQPLPHNTQSLPKVGKTLKDLLDSSEDNSSGVGAVTTRSVCPLCQLPLALLISQASIKRHLAECGDTSYSHLKPCPEGVDCVSKVVNHYARYDHSELARYKDLGLMDQTTRHISPSHLLCVQSPSQTPNFKISSTRISEEGQQFPRTDHVDVETQFISPIKVIRRISQRVSAFKCDICERTFDSENAFEDHVCKQKENVRTPSPISRVGLHTPLVRTEQQRKFLRELASDSSKVKHVDIDGDNVSAGQLAKDKRTREWVNFTRSDIFDEDLQDKIEAAIDCVDKNAVTEKNVGERNSGIACQSSVHEKLKPNMVKVMVGDKEVDLSLEPSIPDNSHPSPIKVSAEKDSQELELSLNIDPAVHCTKLRLRVPLKKTESGEERPVQVSANYSPITTPVKQPPITEYFRNTLGGPNQPHAVVENSHGSDNTPRSDLGVVNLKKAKEDWNRIFNRAKANGYASLKTNSDKKKEAAPTNRNAQQKMCPWWKKITNTVLAVDAFNYGDLPGIKHYLLSHFHYDHYIGLSKHWTHHIVCSSITKRLATTFLGVKADLMTVLDPGDSRVVGGCELTAVDANHCPGSVMFVIRLTCGMTLLHVGDCRACHRMEEEPVFWNTRIDRIYLDTTYCKPDYDFPSQEDVIMRTVDIVSEFVATKPDTLVMVGAYTVGKERIFKAIAAGLDAKVWGDKKRRRTWSCLNDKEILSRVVDDRKQAQVQVIMNQLVCWPKLGSEMEKVGGNWTHVLGVKPTGWAHSRGEGRDSSLGRLSVVTRGHVSLLEVPYSEHSSFSELKRFIQFLRIGSEKDIIPTVNVKYNKEMAAMFKNWIEERKALGPESQ